MCRDDDALRQRLHDLGPRAEQVLARLDGRVEWGVKVFQPTVAPVASPGRGEQEAAASGGAAYLRRRRAEAEQRRLTAQLAATAAESIYRQLADLAVAGHRHRPQDPQLSGHGTRMLLNAAFLVEAADVEPFRTTANTIAEERARDVVS